MSLWLQVIEPLFRHWPGYPPDWQRRRMYVFERASGRCESCGMPAGRIKPGDGGWRVAGAHVHHIIPIAAHGRHQFENLRLLCAQCHRAAHPENPTLGLLA